MNELAIYDKIQDPMKAVELLGTMISNSKMYGVQNAAQGQVIALTCLTERMSPLEFMKIYHIVEGRPSKRADRMLFEFQEAGGCVKWHEYDDEVCRATFYAKGDEEGLEYSYTLQQSVDLGISTTFKKEFNGEGWQDNNYPTPLELKLGLQGGKRFLKDNYRKSPGDMLRARVISKALRMVAPGIVSGVYTPEEVSDFEKPTDETQTEAAKNPLHEVKSAAKTKANKPGIIIEPVEPAEPTKKVETKPAATIVTPIKAEVSSEPIEAQAEIQFEEDISTEQNEVTIENSTTLPGEVESDEELDGDKAKEALFVKLEAEEKQVNNWLRKNRRVGANETFREMRGETLDKVLEQPEKFLQVCRDFLNN